MPVVEVQRRYKHSLNKQIILLTKYVLKSQKKPIFRALVLFTNMKENACSVRLLSNTKLTEN
jgi:hypothetical protein